MTTTLHPASILTVEGLPFKASPDNLEKVIAPSDTQISMQDYKTKNQGSMIPPKQK